VESPFQERKRRVRVQFNSEQIQGVLVIANPVILFLGIFGLLYVARKVVLKRLEKAFQNTKTKVDDIILGAASGPSIVWCAMIAAYFAVELSNTPDNIVSVVGQALSIIGTISVTIVVANIAGKMVSTYSGQIESTLPVTSLTHNVTRIVIFIIGILMILNSLHISIAPILATLGVGGLAVALALQDTLANFFAGFHIIIARQIRIGDYIKLENGEDGYVTDITWRTTTIRKLNNNVVFVPNSKLIGAIITNFYFPNKEMNISVNVSVHYDSDLPEVERTVHAAAKEVLVSVSGGVPEFDPIVRFGEFGDSGVGVTVTLRAREFADQGLIKHEFIKKLHERFRKENIVIPYPTRTLLYGQEKTA
jgi:small-conductance mechanosensitive channel